MAESTSPQKLLLCVAGIYFFYLYYGVYQEQVWTKQQDGTRFGATTFLLLCQCAVNAIFAFAGLQVVGLLGSTSSKSAQKREHTDVAISCPAYLKSIASIFGHDLNGYTWMGFISFFYVAAMGCSNAALQHVNYPTQALGKSCKMIPIMVFNVLVNKTRYSWAKYLSALFITGGIVVFRVFKASSKASGANSMVGLVLLFMSLCLDGLTASNQKVYRKEFSEATLHGSLRMMLLTNLWACVHVGIISVVIGDFSSGLAYCNGHQDIVTAIVKFALCSAFGQFFIFFTITGPGPLACTTITTTRKFFTILISVFMNPENSLTTKQWGGVGLVFAGLTGELYEKYADQREKKG